jgi:DNA-binding HxlR family transcriptional regulator
MKKIKKRSDCPISSALDIIGDKWSLLIIREMIFSNKNTYNEFLKIEEKIATNILADRLSMLEMAEILMKEEHPDSKAKIFYRLTNKGIDLLHIMVEMILWSNKYLVISEQAKTFAEALKQNKQAIIENLSTNLRK